MGIPGGPAGLGHVEGKAQKRFDLLGWGLAGGRWMHHRAMLRCLFSYYIISCVLVFPFFLFLLFFLAFLFFDFDAVLEACKWNSGEFVPCVPSRSRVNLQLFDVE